MDGGVFCSSIKHRFCSLCGLNRKTKLYVYLRQNLYESIFSCWKLNCHRSQQRILFRGLITINCDVVRSIYFRPFYNTYVCTTSYVCQWSERHNVHSFTINFSPVIFKKYGVLCLLRLKFSPNLLSYPVSIRFTEFKLFQGGFILECF